MARFTATVDLPTPPLPAPTATTFFTCGRAPWRGPGAARVLAESSIFTCSAPAARRAAVTSFSMRSFNGQAGVVNSMFTITVPPSMRTSLTMLSVTMSLKSSGSWTLLRALMTCSRDNAIA